MNPMGGETRMRAENGDVQSHMHLRTGDRDALNGGRRILTDAKSRASDLADRTRARLGDTVDRASELLERRSELPAAVRENPLLALGAAFTLGLTIGAVTGGRQRHWLVDRARRQIRAALIGGITATLAHEIRAVAGLEHGFGELLRSLIDEHDHPDFDEYDGEPRDYPA